MKILSGIIIFLILISFKVSAQEIKRDSIKIISNTDNLQKLQIQFDEFEIYRNLNYMKFNLSAEGNKNTIWMLTDLIISRTGQQNYYGSKNSSLDLISPLQLEYLENSKLDPVRYVLGMAQTAAVGYLAYIHIKKYGLFK